MPLCTVTEEVVFESAVAVGVFVGVVVAAVGAVTAVDVVDVDVVGVGVGGEGVYLGSVPELGTPERCRWQ